MNSQRRFPTAAVLLVVVALAAILAGVWAGTRLPGNAPPELESATYLPEGKPLPAFELVDHTGAAFGPEQLKGRWTFMFFGYTFCPDVCPVTMTALGEAWKQMEAQELTDDAQVVMVSVDPKRDTPERLAEYVPYFNPSFVGVTGKHDQLEKLTRGLGLLYVVHDDGSEHYLVDHSSAVLIIGPRGELRALFRPPLLADVLTRDFAAVRAADRS